MRSSKNDFRIRVTAALLVGTGAASSGVFTTVNPISARVGESNTVFDVADGTAPDAPDAPVNPIPAVPDADGE